MRDWLEPYRGDMEKALAPPVDIVYQASLLWRMIYGVVWQFQQKFPEFHIVRHEDLSLQPLQEFKALYDALGVPFTRQVAESIHKSTNPGNPTELPLESVHSVTLDSRANLKNWTKRLSEDEIEKVKDLTRDVWQLYYQEEDWH